jgi:hypothetical protein
MTDTTDRGREHDELLLQARARLERQAQKLAFILGPHDTGATLIAIGMTVLAATYGRERAAAVLRGSADDLEEDDDAPIEVKPIGGRA